MSARSPLALAVFEALVSLQREGRATTSIGEICERASSASSEALAALDALLREGLVSVHGKMPDDGPEVPPSGWLVPDLEAADVFLADTRALLALAEVTVTPKARTRVTDLVG